MNLLGSFVIAFSMYSRVPMPQVEWTKERMRYAMCFFPLIGAVIGAALILLLRAFRQLGAGPIFFVLSGTVLPLLITGGIHMDGYLDVTDARHSYGEKEKKLEILKDPHTGAFAIIGFGIYLLCYAAAFSELSEKQIWLLAAVFVIERALSGLSIVSFPMAKKDGMAAQFSQAAVKRTVRVVMVLYLIGAAFYLLDLGGMTGMICLMGALASFFLYYRMAVREFGGINGDLAGHFLQSCERNTVILLALCKLAGL